MIDLTFQQRIRVFLLLLCTVIFSMFTGDLNAQLPDELDADCSRMPLNCEPSSLDPRFEWTTGAPTVDLDCRGFPVTNPLWHRFVAGTGDMTFYLERLECNPGGFFSPGLMITIWETCVNGFGNATCIAASGCPMNGGLPNPFLEFEVPEGVLLPGQTYAYSVSGCEDAMCTFTLEIEHDDLDIPPLDDPSVSLSTEACISDLPPFTYCQGNPVYIEVDNDIYDVVGAEWWWCINELDASADATTVSWVMSNASGVGTPMINGEVNEAIWARNRLAFNGIELNFQEVGTYEVCLNLLRTHCGEVQGGPLCQTVTIVPPPEKQIFPKFDLCYSYLFDNNWPGPPMPNELGETWIAGSIGLSDVLSSPLDEDDNYVVTLPTPVDRCGCSFDQEVTINIVGDNDPGEVELFLIECQLPYTWFDIIIYELDEFYSAPARLSQASLEKDFLGIQCDSFVTITIIETDVQAQVTESDCTDEGKEFTFELAGIELQGADYQWIDSVTGLDATPVSESPSAFLPTGTYYVFISGFIEDLNHNDNSQGTQPLSFISCEFGPFELLNPIPEIPQVVPYDPYLCPEEQLNVNFQIDSIVDSLQLTYHWLIPESILGQEVYRPDSASLTIIDIAGLADEDTLSVYAVDECGTSDTLLIPVELLTNVEIPIFNPRIECSGQSFNVSYPYTLGATYEWDFTPGITAGNTSDGSDFQVTYNDTGSFTYSVIITSADSCITMGGPYEIDIFDLPPAPEVQCNDMEQPNSITFQWTELGDLEYSVELIEPQLASTTLNGNVFEVFDIEANTEVTISVTATNDGPVECNESVTTITCSTAICDLPEIERENFVDINLCQNDFPFNSIQYNIAPPPGISGTYEGPGITPNGLLDLNDPTFSNPGEYTIEYNYLEDASGCSDRIEITITIEPEIIVSLIDELLFCLGDSEEISAVVSGGDGGPYNFDWSDGSSSNGITLPLAGEDQAGLYSISLNVTDNTTTCEVNKTISYTIYNEVPIINEVVVSCNNNGTELDLTDDYYDVLLNVSQDQNSGAGMFALTANGSAIGDFSYNTQAVFQLPAEGQEVTLGLTDLTLHGCYNETTIGPLIPCEPACEIQSSTIVLCNDNGTTDPDDDFYTIKVVAFVTNPGASNSFILTVEGEDMGTFNYMDGAEFMYPAGSVIMVTLTDADKESCEVSSMINLEPCSFEKYVCDEGAVKGLNLEGPIKQAITSNSMDGLAAQRLILNEGKLTKLTVYGARDALKAVCDPDTSEFSLVFYENENNLPGTQSENFVLKSDIDSSGIWNDPDSGTDFLITKYTLDIGQVVNIEDGWFSLEIINEDCDFVWLSGANAPITGGAIQDTSGVWQTNSSFNYCAFYESVSVDVTSFDNIKVYPNPVQQILYADNLTDIKSMTLLNIHGQIMVNKKVNALNERVEMRDLSSGIYLFYLEDNQGYIRTYKIFKE